MSSGKEWKSGLIKLQAGLFWYSPDFLPCEGQLVSWLSERPLGDCLKEGQCLGECLSPQLPAATIASPFPVSGWRTKWIPGTDIVLWMALLLGGLIGLKVELDWDKHSWECSWALLFHLVCSLPASQRQVEPRGWEVRSASRLNKRCPRVPPGDSSSPSSTFVRGFLILTSNKVCTYLLCLLCSVYLGAGLLRAAV